MKDKEHPYMMMIEAREAADNLRIAFVWGLTKEGPHYWSIVAMELKNIYVYGILKK